VGALVAPLKLDLELPKAWMAEVARRFRKGSSDLDVAQLRSLGDVALAADARDLAYAVSAAGLERGESDEPRFLLLRARSVTAIARRRACAWAAAELARQRQDAGLVEEALEVAEASSWPGLGSLTIDQARGVLRRERAERTAPSARRPGPDYGPLVSVCQCADCRRAREGPIDPFDDDLEDTDDVWDSPGGPPPRMPPEIAAVLFEAAQQAMRRGESVESFMARLIGAGLPRRRRKSRGN
jgi:hypothetical protein